MELLTKLKELKKLRLSDFFAKEKIKKFIDYEKELAHNPHKLALSFAIGIFVGLSIPMGLQTIIAIPFALIFRCNIFVVYLATLITNPFTAIFIYTAMFKIGELVTGNYVQYDHIQNLLRNFSVKQLGLIGSVALNNYLIGMIITTIITTPLSYYFVLYYINRKRFLQLRKKTKIN